MKRIAVLMGGPSREHDVSMASGQQVLQALGDAAFAVVLQRNGLWVVDGERFESPWAAVQRLGEVASEAFLALHGPFGEDGTVQALMECLGLPYTGSGVAASALAMDKIRTKHVYRSVGLPTPPFADFTGKDSIQEMEARLALVPGPWVVKPARDGSSFGVSFCQTPAQVEGRLRAELDGGVREILVESRIQGREFTCGVLEDAAGVPRALPVTELVVGQDHEFFDTAAKYEPGATEEVTPARIPAPIRDRIQALALLAHRALGCRDMSRTDALWSEVAGLEGVVLLETNTIPGFTATSLLPQAAAADGMPFERLVHHLVACARARAADMAGPSSVS